MTRDDVTRRVKAYIFEEFLSHENPDLLTEATPLVTGGILDSIATLDLVSFLEEEFGIAVEAHEVDVENFNNLTKIADLVLSKLS